MPHGFHETSAFSGAMVACRLQNLPTMNAEHAIWRRLNPDIIADLPEDAGVFEVANLVRTVLLISAAEGNLRERLSALAREPKKLPASPGGYWFRYEATAREDETLASRLGAYRAAHDGALPAGNREARGKLRLAERSAA